MKDIKAAIKFLYTKAKIKGRSPVACSDTLPLGMMDALGLYRSSRISDSMVRTLDRALTYTGRTPENKHKSTRTNIN